MTLAELFLTNLALVFGCMAVLWVISIPIRNVSIVDLFWGFGFVLVAWSSGLIGEWPPSPRSGLMLALVTFWGMRLTGYLAWRNLGRSEDFRYRAMRDAAGGRFILRSVWIVFGLQGILMAVISLPVQAAIHQGGEIGAWDVLGMIIFGIGWIFEAVGDWQLARFKANPGNQGRVLDRGLWKYTRHPNYFGDCCVWWGLYFVSVGAGAGWTVVSPLIMTFLLLQFSGVALLEKTLTARGPEYNDYVRRTSAFFPRPPRNGLRSDL